VPTRKLIGNFKLNFNKKGNYFLLNFSENKSKSMEINTKRFFSKILYKYLYFDDFIFIQSEKISCESILKVDHKHEKTLTRAAIEINKKNVYNKTNFLLIFLTLFFL
jgi:hypothetical protein